MMLCAQRWASVVAGGRKSANQPTSSCNTLYKGAIGSNSFSTCGSRQSWLVVGGMLVMALLSRVEHNSKGEGSSKHTHTHNWEREGEEMKNPNDLCLACFVFNSIASSQSL